MTKIACRNEVLLVGRLVAPAEVRELPGGEVVSTFRLAVERPPATKKAQLRGVYTGTRPSTVDTIDCIIHVGRLIREARNWQPGDGLTVEGSLRRRFNNGPGGLISRYEVEAVVAKRLANDHATPA